MTRKPNFWKFILGVAALAAFFIGTLAVTRAPRTNAAKASESPRTSLSRTGKAGLSNLAIPTAAPNPAAVTDAFELDGNATEDASPLDDWATLDAGGGSAIAKTVGTAPSQVAIADPQGDTIFTTGGSKDDLDIPSWRNSSGNVPPKDEITNAYAALYNVSGESILVFGADRFAQSGASQIGFWFFQNDVHPDTATGLFSGVHQNGDVLILSDFTVGGSITTIRVFAWHSPGGSINGTLDQIGVGADCHSGASPNFCGEVNQVATASPWAYTPKSGPSGTFPIGAFYEGGVNLTALGIGQNVCFAAFLAETRSSPSVDATLKDFVSGSFPQKPTVSGTGTTLTCSNPTGQISATSNNPNATFSWTGPGGFTATGTPVTVSVAGTYTVIASSQGGCPSDPFDVTVGEDKTAPNADAGPDKLLTCSITSVQLAGSSATTGATPHWVASNGGNIVSGADTFTPTVNAAGTYTLTVTNNVNGCTNIASADVTQDTTPPSLTIEKKSANETANPQSVGLGFVGSAPSGVSFQWQSCVANCGVDASWSDITGATLSTLTFSNFALDTAESITFTIASGNGAGTYNAQLFVVQLRVHGTNTSNGCSANSNAVTVKKALAVDP